MNGWMKNEYPTCVTMGNSLKLSEIQFLQRRLDDFKAQ